MASVDMGLARSRRTSCGFGLRVEPTFSVPCRPTPAQAERQDENWKAKKKYFARFSGANRYNARRLRV
jgi:hypothetical protein